jgi:hypothetical protein
MRWRWRCDNYGVNCWVIECIVQHVCRSHVTKARLDLRSPRGVEFDCPPHASSKLTVKISDQVRTPMARTDNRNLNHDALLAVRARGAVAIAP